MPQQEFPRREFPQWRNAADAGTEKAPKAEAEKVQGEPRPENADRKPEKGAQSPNRPSKAGAARAEARKTNPKKAAEREQEQNVDKPAEHKPEKAEPVRNNVADKVADSVNDAQETKDKNNKEMPGANKETKQNSEQAAKAKNTAEKPKFPQSPTLPNVLRNGPKMQSSQRRTSLPKTEGIPTEAAVRKERTTAAAATGLPTTEIPAATDRRATGLPTTEIHAVTDRRATGLLTTEIHAVTDRRATGLLTTGTHAVTDRRATGLLDRERTR